MRTQRLLVALIGLAATLAVTLPQTDPVQSQTPPVTQGRVRLVFISDTNANNGEIYRHNAERMRKVFHDANALDPTRPYDDPILVQGNKVNTADVLRAVAGLSVRPDVDTVLVFYWGHGASDAQHKNFFTLRNGENVGRDRVLGAITARRPRLSILLSDTCSVIHPIKEKIFGAPQVEVNWKVLRTLLLGHRGVLDANAAKPGQYSFNLPLDPKETFIGLFTKCLIDACYDDETASDWPTVLQKVGESANGLFTRFGVGNSAVCKKVGQRSQDPHAYAWPVRLTRTEGTIPPDGGPPRGVREVRLDLPLQVRLQDVAEGLLVTEVLPGGPAAQAVVQRGDVILTVNGQKMTYRQYDAFRTSAPAPRQAVFRIAQVCGCGCGKLHKDCQDSCSWGVGGRGTPCRTDAATPREPDSRLGNAAVRTWVERGPFPLSWSTPFTLHGKLPITDGAGDQFTIFCVVRSNAAPDHPRVLKAEGGELIFPAATVTPAGPREVFAVKLEVTADLFKGVRLEPGRHVVRAYWMAWNATKGWVKMDEAWGAGLRILVDKADDGSVKLLPFGGGTFQTPDEDASSTIPAKACDLRVKHLVLRPGTTLFQARQSFPMAGTPQTVEYLRAPPKAVRFRNSLDLGLCFGLIDTPDKAAELANLVGSGASRLIKTRAQYLAFKQGLESRGWEASPWLRGKLPPSFGVRVGEFPEAGYVVDVLSIEEFGESLYNVQYTTWTVTREGELWCQPTIYIKAPTHGPRAPAQPAGHPRMTHTEYNQYLRSLFTADGMEMILAPFAATDRMIRVPVPGGHKREEFSEFEDRPATTNGDRPGSRD